MEQQELYEYKSTKSTTVSDTDRNILGLPDLDPTFEDSFDLQSLINGTISEFPQQIDIDLAFPTSPKASLQNETHDDATAILLTQHGVEPSEYDIFNLVETENSQLTNFMTQGDGTSPDSWSEVVTVKREEPELASCQAVSPISDSSSPPPTENLTPGRKTSGKGSRKRKLNKDSQEYAEKRTRNNIAVRKSRDKAKLRQNETEGRVKALVDENEELQKKVDLLSKELNVLKGLFINVGANLPDSFKKIMEQ